MATYTYEIGTITRSVTSPRGKGNYSYGAQHTFLPTNDIPPFSTINSVTLTHTQTNFTGTFRKSIYPSSTTDGTLISTTPLTFDVSTVGGSQTARAGKMIYHFSIYTSAQGSGGAIFGKTTTSTATRNDVALTYDYTPPDTLINFYIKNPSTNTIESFPYFKTDTIIRKLTSFSGSYHPSSYDSGSYIPTPFQGTLRSPTSADLVVSPTYNYYEGYHPAYWIDEENNQYDIDDSGNTIITWNTEDEQKDFTLVFAKNTYTVNFWDNTKEPAVLFDSMLCEGDTTYSTPNLPQYDEKSGYSVGYVKQLVDPSNSNYYKICRNSSDNLLYYYLPPKDLGNSVTQYSSFKNLTLTNNDVVDLYFIQVPIRYSINYKSRLTTESSYSTATQYRIYEEKAETLLNLNTVKYLYTGHKWLNSEPNSWYTEEKTASTGYSPEGEQITSIPLNYIGDINLYAYQAPIEYKVVRHVYDVDGNEINYGGGGNP